MRRESMWTSLTGAFDMVVVGGGVTGCGIARDAARRGLRVALVEMNDFAFGTSSRSSKLVHGGLRYLEQYEFNLVFEAVSERRILMDIAPHLVRPLGFLFPVYEHSRHKLWFINAGMWVYDGLSLFRSPQRHQNLDTEEVLGEEPLLGRKGLTGASLYYDCATDDARITLENALDAASHGACVCSYAKVIGFKTDARGRVSGVEIQDRTSGEKRVIEATAVVNATGPWTDQTLAMSGRGPKKPLLRPTKGVHIVVGHQALPLQHAVLCMHPEDGRVMFAIPWGDQTYIGTTDTDDVNDPSAVYATAEDVSYILEVVKTHFPDSSLTSDQVRSTWAGLRPLMCPVESSSDGLDESSVSREHQIVVGQDGLVTIAGGKLTTYRRMAAEVVDTVIKLLRLSDRMPPGLDASRTDEEPLPGAVGWPADDDRTKVRDRAHAASEGRLSLESAMLLTDTYGMSALDVARLVAAHPSLAEPIVSGRPEVMAQVDWAVRMELANEVSDVLMRRTQLFFRDSDQGLGGVERVGAYMAEALGWSTERREQSEEGYREEVALSRGWRD